MDKPCIKKIKRHKVKIYTPDDVCLGKADDIQMLDFRIQMIEHPDRLEGYYIMYKGKRHNIGINGSKMESSLKVFLSKDISYPQNYLDYKERRDI